MKSRESMPDHGPPSRTTRSGRGNACSGRSLNVIFSCGACTMDASLELCVFFFVGGVHGGCVCVFFLLVVLMVLDVVMSVALVFMGFLMA